ATVATAFVSEILVHSLDAFAHAVGASEFFVAAVIVAIVGNAAEHGGAVVIARAGKMELASEIAISSSAQVALLVTPAVMLLSLFFAHQLPLTFRWEEAVAMAGAVVLGVSLGVEGGQLVAVMGPSGSGKSTLMHILAGLDKPTSGTVTIAGTEITTLADSKLTRLRRQHIGFVFQFFNLLPMLTAEENVVLPLSIAGKKPDKAWLQELTQKVGLEDRRTHRPAELSGGQQQRVANARALVPRPTVMFADEPTGNLDSTTSGEILELLRSSVEAYGQTTVMVTHDPHAA